MVLVYVIPFRAIREHLPKEGIKDAFTIVCVSAGSFPVGNRVKLDFYGKWSRFTEWLQKALKRQLWQKIQHY